LPVGSVEVLSGCCNKIFQQLPAVIKRVHNENLPDTESNKPGRYLENMQLECSNVLLQMGSYIKVVEQNAVYFLILIPAKALWMDV